MEDFQNECVSIFDFKHAESVKDETKGGDKQPDYERKFVFWNETKKFQRKLRLAQQGNFHQNFSLWKWPVFWNETGGSFKFKVDSVI